MILFILSLVCLFQTTFTQLRNNACKHLPDYFYLDSSHFCYFNPDVEATTPQIIHNHGFQVESYNVTTFDGYILQLFRIPPKLADNRKNKQPIFFNHGLLSDSSAFVFAGERSLALSFARDGYDVWLNNHRGSKYSPKHVSLDGASREYWNWTIDTVATNDLPPTLELIADVTGKGGSIIYVGHSRGTILAFMYVLNNPQSKLLRGLVALAPVAYQDVQLYFRVGSTFVPLLENVLPRFRMWAFFEDSTLITSTTQSWCPLFPQTCKMMADLFSGESDQFLPDDLLNFFNHFPASYSVQEMVHENQLIRANLLQKFDYGKKNMEVYGQPKPPIYDLGKVTLPVYLFYGRHDAVISEKSVLRQFRDLGSKEKDIFKIPIGNDDEKFQWAHNDFLFGKDIQKLLYKPMKKLFEKKLQPIIN